MYRGLLVERCLQVDSIQTVIHQAWLQRVLDITFDAQALESPSEKLQNTFVEANRLQISWLEIWS